MVVQQGYEAVGHTHSSPNYPLKRDITVEIIKAIARRRRSTLLMGSWLAGGRLTITNEVEFPDINLD
jgi:hypothetical protein